MDHQGAGVGSQNEAFYDLLKTSNNNDNSNPNFFHRSGENPSPEIEFGHDDVLPTFNFHPVQINGTAPSQTTIGVYSSSGGDDAPSGGIKGHQASAPPSSYESQVQTGVQVLRDKQEIVEHHSQLAKLQLKSDAPGNISSSSSTSEGPPKFVTQGNQPELSMKQPLSAPCQQQQIRSPPATIQQQQLPSLPPPAAYQQQQLPPLPQPQIPLGHQQQLQQSVPQQENLHQASLHRQSLPSAPQQHQVPPQYQPQPIHMQPQLQQHVPQGPGPLQQYNQQPDMPPFSSLPHGQHFQGAQQAPHYSASFSSETLPYMPSKYEPLSDRQSLTQYQSPPQTPHGPSGAQRYEPFPGKAPAQVPAPPPYLPHAQPVPAAPAYEPQPSMGYRVVQPSPAPSGGGGYPRLPTAQPVHTMANPSSSNGMPSGNRSSVDDVIEHVAGMGFSREQARAVVRRLKENGQSVDLNIVLDRLMNGGDSQPQKAWLGR
ncbi:hypothetical protein O6H91_07G103300 [Diphasiastrum complanatum]|uniref:Uncharacterized protein n=1 Tax=Diphasiastrum complanatum TaxID=34168 RepID=A0ACC2D8C4_DIPCM|nr:hypothetical protein O6H91_07G103300 [Diphasiastrum complanatum]